ncbi:MAG: RNA-directed DNA polymerase, partial [bacterium]|nr:RNA-directed DNA polymerase [bacterium]
EILKIEHPDLTQAQRDAALELLLKNNNCVSLDHGELGTTKGIEVEIDTEGARPIRQALRQLAYVLRDEVKEEVDKLLRLRVVQESNSPWSSPIVAVCKKDGTLRLCVDYRKLNVVTRKDAFPLPRCDDLLNAAGQGTPQVITKLDMMQGYHQVPLSADASQKTAFVTPEGHYQYRTMPYRLACVPAIFQRLMSRVYVDCRSSTSTGTSMTSSSSRRHLNCT